MTTETNFYRFKNLCLAVAGAFALLHTTGIYAQATDKPASALASAKAPESKSAATPASAKAPEAKPAPAPASTGVNTPVQKPAPAQTKAAQSGKSKDKPDINRLLSQLVNDFNLAINKKNFAEAKNILGIMERHLHEQSLTLLRMKAWYAFSAEQDDDAIMLYRQLLERVAHDENAAVNLAILEARAGNIDEARRIINALTDNIKNLEQVDALKQSFGIETK